MFSTRPIIKYILTALCVAAMLLSCCSCVDFDKVMDSLIGTESQNSAVSRPSGDESTGDEVSADMPYTAEDAFTVSPYGDGVAIDSYNGDEPYVKIPETIGGKSVLAINANAVCDKTTEDGEATLVTVTHIIVPKTVTVIAGGAFSGCKGLLSIELPFIGGTDGGGSFGYVFGGKAPDSLNDVVVGSKTIADGAFEGCELLESVTLTEAETVGNGAFKNCKNLEKIVIPQSVTSMGSGLFEGCESLEELALPYLGNGSDIVHAGYIFGAPDYKQNINYMPASLKKLTVCMEGVVPAYCFYECDRLTSLTIKGNIKTVGESSFYRCKRLKTLNLLGDEDFGGVNALGVGAFAYCSSLGEIRLSAELSTLPEKSFYSCSSLRSIYFGEELNKLPESVSSIGKSAFAYCESLSAMGLTEKITEIPDEAFVGCAYLTSVSMPKTVTSIGQNAFKGCSNLSSLSFEEGTRLTTVGDGAFAYCTLLKTVALPESVSELGSYVFSHCWSLNSASLPKALTAIPDGCFFGCTVLKELQYSESKVSSIGERAFSGCERIESISLPSGIENIGAHAFDECEKLVFTVSADTYAYDWLLKNGIGGTNLNLK